MRSKNIIEGFTIFQGNTEKTLSVIIPQQNW